MLAGTAGCWFLLDYAYYGNTISTPQILSLITPNASTMTKIALQLAIFVVAAVPGYILAIARLDRIGHRKLQLIGFAMMAVCFLVIAIVPGMTTTVAPFLIVYGISYFFTEFGPNMTTFVLPSEIYPVSMRATGHGISAGVGKLGAFIGVFLFPVLQSSLGLRGTLLLTGGVSVLGLALTLVLPEPAGPAWTTSPPAWTLHPRPPSSASRSARSRAPTRSARRRSVRRGLRCWHASLAATSRLRCASHGHGRARRLRPIRARPAPGPGRRPSQRRHCRPR